MYRTVNINVSYFFFIQLAKTEDLDNDIEEVLHTFEEKCQRPILHSIVFY